MKNNLGRLFFLLLLPLLLFADSNLASYTLIANKYDVVEKEAVEITLTASQKDHANTMYFFLEPKKNANYEVILLSQNTKKSSAHDSSMTFTYLLFPLKSGDITVDFDLTVKVATDQAITDVYTGTRDSAKQEKTTNSSIKIEPLHLHVSPLSQNVQLVGDFTLESKLQKNEINKYGAAKLSYTLSGIGYQGATLEPLGKIKDVTTFSQKNDLENEVEANGYKLKREYSYALSSDKNFQVPSIELTAYSPKLKKYYTLKAPSYTINVNSIDDTTLVDKKDFPMAKTFDLESLKQFTIALSIFCAGFFTAKVAPNISFKRTQKEKFDDIKNAKNAKKLILILMQNYSHYDVKENIDALERLEYKKESKTLKEIKSDVLKNIM